MRKSLLLAILMVCALVSLAFANNAALVTRVDEVLSKLKQYSFNELVSDQVIEKTVVKLSDRGFDSWNVNTTARHAVFETHIRPAFDDGLQYGNALYAAYSGGEWYFKNDNIPLALDKPLNDCRETIMDLARGHLKSPERLLSFYEAKKVTIIEQLRKKDDAVRIKHWLQNAKVAMEKFNNDQFQVAYCDYMKAREDWLRHLEGEKTAYKGYKHAAETLSRDSFEVMQKLEGRLKEITPDLYTSLFIGRRNVEGGSELVKVYIHIADDLINSTF